MESKQARLAKAKKTGITTPSVGRVNGLNMSL